MMKSFFWMCSGADTDLLSQSPKSEQIKYAGIGGTVFFTALMAFIASGYALYTVFDNLIASIFFGLIWGLLIFNLDRFIVSSIKKRDRKSDEFAQAVPRLILALIIAVVISTPLELKIFEKEINAQLLQTKNAMTVENQSQVKTIYASELDALKNEHAAIDQKITTKELEVNGLYDTYIAEAEGAAGTMRVGKGPVYKEKREKHDALLAELSELKTDARLQQREIDSSIEEVMLAQSTHISETQPIIDGFDGLMARVNALHTLPWLPSFFIFLLFLAIETSPIFAKLLSPKGSYDIRMAEAEDAVAVWAAQKQRQRAALLAADSYLNKRVYTSIEEEEETYHYKKQQARALIRFQTDVFLDEQKMLSKGGA
jgi:hypothetical protein